MDTQLMPILVVALLAVPLIGATAAALLGGRRIAAVRWVSLGATLFAAIIAIVLAWGFARTQAQEPETPLAAGQVATFRPFFVPGADSDHATTWELVRVGGSAGGASIRFFVGIDGLNIWLVVLTAVLMVSAVLVSWTAIRERANEFYAWLLALQTAMTGVFLAFDVVLFYVFFELTLVPLFFLIGMWGGSQRRYAARKFFVYTLAGSLLTLLGILGVVLACYWSTDELTFSIPRLVEVVGQRMALDSAPEQVSWQNIQFWVFLAMAAGFAVKVPLVPFHTWLPLAHVEAPTAGSVLLAGVLLKVGAYGFLRLCLPLAPWASGVIGMPLVGTLAAIGIVYGAFCALSQSDMKKLVAYSSVSHLGFCMLGMFSLNREGLSGSLLQMVNHGLSTGALFLLVGMLYERYHTRALRDYGGLAARLGLLACFMVFFCLTSVGLPGLNGFVGEILVLAGAFQSQVTRGEWPTMAVVASSGIVLGAWYLFRLLREVFFGSLREPSVQGTRESHPPVRDLTARELGALIPIAGLCLLLGVVPQILLDSIRRDVDVVVRAVESGRATDPGRSMVRLRGMPMPVNKEEGR